MVANEYTDFIKRDEARRERLIAEIKNTYPGYDFTGCKTGGSLYSKFHMYLDAQNMITTDGLITYKSKTDYGFTLEWKASHNYKIAIVQTSNKYYVFDEFYSDTICVSVFYTTTGNRVKGERHFRKSHTNSKGTYVEIDGKREYLHYQVAEVTDPQPKAEPMKEGIEAMITTTTEPNYDEMAVAAATNKDAEALVQCVTRGPGVIIVPVGDSLDLRITLLGESRGLVEVGYNHSEGFLMQHKAQAQDFEMYRDKIVDALVHYLPTTALEAWGYKPYIFIQGYDDIITSGQPCQVVEDYESDDMTVAYQIIRAMVKPGTLLKQLGSDNIERYAIVDVDGNVEAWNPIENMVAYIERPSVSGQRVYVLNTNYFHLGEWYYKNPIDGIWVKRDSAPSMETVNAITGAKVRLSEVKGAKREELIASFHSDLLKYAAEFIDEGVK